MNTLQRIGLIPFLLLLLLFGASARAADDDGEWTPTPPRLAYIDGEVSYWRPGADAWAQAGPNLALAEGDALYTGSDANFEVQFGGRSFVRADADTQLSLVQQEERRIQFKLASGRASFDCRDIEAGDVLEVSTPHAVFVIEHPGYYRVEVDTRETHFITRRGGEATVITADGRSLSIYRSEEIVVTGGEPVRVATYAAPAPDAWDRWNDARSDRIGESVSARYLPAGVYGAEDLDHYGHWRVVPTYGSVWIPYGMSATWVPYSTGHWVWHPYYEWTWVDDAPWGWAPFHYGRWVYIDGFWAWAPGPVVRRPVYAPALVAFMIHDHDVSVRLSLGLPGVWWVALSWGEPALPWWGPPRRRWQPYWGGWGGPRIVNNVVIKQTTIVKTDAIRFHNAQRAVLTAPADRFGRERVRATVESRYRYTEFVPARDGLPVKRVPASLVGGAPKGLQPPQAIVARPVVSTRLPRERRPDAQADGVRTRDLTGSRYVVPPVRAVDNARTPTRPPFGSDAGPERAPLPRPPRYDDLRKSTAPRAVTPPTPTLPREGGATRSPATSREPINPRLNERRQVQPAEPRVSVPTPARPSVPSVQPPRARPDSGPQRSEVRRERALPGQPASRTFRGRDREKP